MDWSGLHTLFAVWTVAYFWRETFGTLISSLWRGGTGPRLLLLVLVLVLAGPVVRGIGNLALAIYRRVRSIERKIRFRLETGWRVEAAELIDALPAFEDLPGTILSDLAGRVVLRDILPGQPVIRQGDRSTAFYVIRKGTFNVETEHPETSDVQLLDTLGRGESFGEIGLLQNSLRQATVRAAGEGEVFEIDKGTFDRLLADPINAPTFGPTLQALAELRGLKVFGLPEQKERIDARIDRVRQWLVKAAPEDTEDRVFRLRAIQLIGVSEETVRQAAKDLQTSQRSDGGWAQRDDMESDAYATGTALVALHETGGMATDDSIYSKGLEYLVSIQKDDGSWHVASRSKPFQTYFESGYPHDKDQFISIAAASWSTTALALALALPKLTAQSE